MQTFVPYPDLERSAAVLDTPRLGKQRVETLQILRALVLGDYGWRSHPAVVMWRGYVPGLVAYGLACVAEWTRRGHADATAPLITEFAPEAVPLTQADLEREGLLPPWWGDDALHLSHRAALVRKDPATYRPVFGDDVPEDLPYHWPGAPDGAAEDEPAVTGTSPATDGPGDRVPGRGVEPLDGEGEPLLVLRGRDPGTVEDWLRTGVATLPVTGPSGRRSPKWARQVDAWRDDVRAGDPVAVLVEDGAALRPGRVTGDAAERDGLLTRPVLWSGALLPRAAVRPPGALQDPRSLFAVRV